MDIDDNLDNWDEKMEDINEGIKKKALENGITKESYYANYGFKEFKLTSNKAEY